MKIIKTLAFMLLSVSVFSLPAHAEKIEPQKGQRVTGGGDIVYILSMEELKLSAEQKEGLEKLKNEFEREQASIRAEVKAKRKELEEILKSYEVDAKKIEEKVREMSDLNGRLLLKATMSRVDARKILTRDQFEKAKELIEKRREE